MNSEIEPIIQIVEQPKSRGFRFRYKCEGRYAGSLPGANSKEAHKTYPSIRVRNTGNKAVIVVVSCVTKDAPHRPHPNNLVGKDCNRGVCTVKVKNEAPDVDISFPQLGIQCCKKNQVATELNTRKEIRVDPFNTGFEFSRDNIDTTCVRLCFQAFLPGPKNRFTKIVTPVVSEPIYDKKAVSDLVITRLSKSSSSVTGGEEIFLLCEKVNKEDIQVRFFEEGLNGDPTWEDSGTFGHSDIHKGCAIIFKTPQYVDLNITQPRQVYIQLRRSTDGETSEPKPFQYTPRDDPHGIEAKRQKRQYREAFERDTHWSLFSGPANQSPAFAWLTGSLSLPDLEQLPPGAAAAATNSETGKTMLRQKLLMKEAAQPVALPSSAAATAAAVAPPGNPLGPTDMLEEASLLTFGGLPTVDPNAVMPHNIALNADLNIAEDFVMAEMGFEGAAAEGPSSEALGQLLANFSSS